MLNLTTSNLYRKPRSKQLWIVMLASTDLQTYEHILQPPETDFLTALFLSYMWYTCSINPNVFAFLILKEDESR